MQKQNLSSHIKFLRLITSLEQQNLITYKQKHFLKVNLATKDIQLINLISASQDDSEMQNSILDYLKLQEPQGKLNYNSEESPRKLKKRRNSQSRCSTFNDNKFMLQLEDMTDQLLNVMQTENFINPEILEKLKQFGDLISKTASTSPQGSQKQVITQIDTTAPLIDKMKQLYKDMKQHFNDYQRWHILLMDEKLTTEHLYNVLRIFMKNLIDADEISFINDSEMFTSENVKFQDIQLTEHQQIEIKYLKEQIIHEIQGTYPGLNNLFQCSKYKRNYLLKLKNSNHIVCFHQKQEKENVISNFLSICNEYSFFDEVNQLAYFLIETLKQARVQCFNPLQLSHMIEDISIAFIRCSKYPFIQSLIDLLQERFTVIKENSSGISLDSSVEFDFKDQLSITISVKLDLSKKEHMNVYKELTSCYNKYLRFIKQYYEKSTFYKFFVKSQDSLIFEFDKKGQLIFVSQPITQKMTEEFQINFNPQFSDASYTSIFKNTQLIQHIENYLQEQNKWKLTDSNATYEVFMKFEEKYFKGFFVIFQKGWFRYDNKQLDSWSKIRKSLLQEETNTFLNKLEEKHPQIKNSVVQMFKPKAAQTQSSRFKNSSPLYLEQRNSICLKESELIRLIPKSKGINHFTVYQITETSIDNIDNFNFDILPYSSDWLEKQKVVFSIFRRNNFIEEYKIPEDILCNFLCTLEYKYNKRGNKFHNYDHAVAVMQCTHSISLELIKTKYANLLTQFVRFTLIISGLCHDVSHTGRTNIFEINSLSNLAIRYHDKSVLEQHHAATSIKMLSQPQTNILPNFSSDQFRQFRKLFVSNILYTDISEHFNLMKNFEARAYELDFGTDEDVKLMTGMVIHTSDFAGGSKPFQISKLWSTRVNKEFQEQYTLEGKFGYPQLPYMKDLDQLPIMAKSEVGFFKFIVRPLWASMSKFTEDRLQQSVDNLDQTIVEWEKLMIK